MVTVELISETPDRYTLRARVAEGRGETTHDVTLARADHERLAKSGESATAFVERAFSFLLARESKESILGRFDISVIGRYFPEFEREIKR